MDSYFFVDWNLWIFLINRVSGPLLIKTLGKYAEEARQIVEESVTLAHKAVEKKHAILAGSVGKFDGRFFDEIQNKKIEILTEIFPKKNHRKTSKAGPGSIYKPCETSISYAELTAYHKERMKIFASDARIKLLALENMQGTKEIEVVLTLLKEYPKARFERSNFGLFWLISIKNFQNLIGCLLIPCLWIEWKKLFEFGRAYCQSFRVDQENRL